MQAETQIKQPNVAGFFYPQDPDTLHNTVENLLKNAQITETTPPKAIIAPHAGYIYSGPIAATVYKTLIPAKDRITRVILLGPAHRVGFEGIALSTAHQFKTPLGLIPVATNDMANITSISGVKFFDEAFAMEHSLEVQLPFLQSILTKFSIIPAVVGDAAPELIAKFLETLWGNSETLIVISSDLSHYHDYNTAKNIDKTTTNAILNLDTNAIQNNQACGRLPIKGLLLAAHKAKLEVKLLDLRNSGDTSGDKSRVVGYGAYYFN